MGRKAKRYGGASQNRESLPSQEKAREILHDGEIRGEPITRKQRGLMGVIASGKKPTRAKRR